MGRYEKDIIISIGERDNDDLFRYFGFTSVSSPEDPSKRLYNMRARVVDGPKFAVGRRVELKINDQEAVNLYNELGKLLINCGVINADKT